MSPGKIMMAVAGGISGLIAISLLTGGVALAVVHGTQRDDDGFLTSPIYDMRTNGYALVSEEVDLASRPGDWWPSDPATVRFSVDAVGTKPVFVGIGRASEVDRYLSGVAYDEVTALGVKRSDVTYEPSSGGAPATLPGVQPFWVAASQGQGEQLLEWDLEKGEWKMVVMNADASRALRADIEAGAKVGFLLPIGIGFIVAGVLFGGLTVALLVMALSGNRRERTFSRPEVDATV